MEMGFNLLRGITTIKGLAARGLGKGGVGKRRVEVNFPRVTLAWLSAMSGGSEYKHPFEPMLPVLLLGLLRQESICRVLID